MLHCQLLLTGWRCHRKMNNGMPDYSTADNSQHLTNRLLLLLPSVPLLPAL
jgi:hypothetical protein